MDAHKNFSYSTVATAPTLPASGTTLTVATAAAFDDPATVGAYNVTVWPTGAQPLSSTAEIVRVTAKSGAVLTFTRVQEVTANVPADEQNSSTTNQSDAFTIQASTERQAQSFLAPGSYRVSGVEVYLGTIGTPVDHLIVELRASSGSDPGTVLASDTISVADIGAGQWVAKYFEVDLTSATTYWIALYRSGATDLSNYYTFRGNLSDVYANGLASQSVDSGASWIPNVGRERWFKVHFCDTQARVIVVGDQIANTITAKVMTDVEAELGQTNTSPGADVTILANHCAVVLEEYVMGATYELIFADPSEMAVI